MKKILVIGDIHFPYHNKKAIREVLRAAQKEKPTHIIQIGDLYDQYCFSRFTKKNIQLPKKELEAARDYAQRFWRDLVTVSGRRAVCYQLWGNHDIRAIKRVAEKVPELQEIFQEKLSEYYQFKGVTTLEDDRDVLEIGGITFHHGYLSQLGAHCKYFGSSVVVGHSHTGGVVYEQRDGRIIWELNAGYLADETAEPLRYRPTKTSKWTLGYGLITYRGKTACPSFIPIEV